MARMIKNATQEVGSYLRNGVSKSETDKNLGPLGCLVSIHTPNVAEKAKQEVDSTEQEVG